MSVPTSQFFPLLPPTAIHDFLSLKTERDGSFLKLIRYIQKTSSLILNTVIIKVPFANKLLTGAKSDTVERWEGH